MFALISDPNISGELQLQVDSPESLRDLLADIRGAWRDLGNGYVLLTEPEAQVFIGIEDPAGYDALQDPYPDYVVTSTSIERA